jgi:hypothetical protein
MRAKKAAKRRRLTYREAMQDDLPALMSCENIALLSGWENSPGADIEIRLAALCGSQFYDDDTMEPIPTPGRAALPLPIRRAISRMCDVLGAKNADYATDASWRSNFDDMAAQEILQGAYQAADLLVELKQSRLRALRSSGRRPRNESVDDTYLDRANYATLALALLMDDLARKESA